MSLRMVRLSTAGMLAVSALALAGAACAEDAAGTASNARDLNGVWTNRSLTPLERVASDKGLVISEDEALKREAAAADQMAVANARSDHEDELLNDGDATAGYNAFWVDPGSRVTRINGEARTSGVVSTEDGRIPFIDRAKSTSVVRQQGVEYVTGRGDYLGPEDVPLRERCLIGFGNTGGPGMLNTLYNNTYRFVLTDDHLVILVEMVHDARIAPIFDSKAEAQASHKPDAIAQWLGDTVAWWEGDTLVMETVNVHPAQASQSNVPLSPEGKVTERLRRVSDDQIHYSFEFDDPGHYSEPWTAELSFSPVEGDVYKYACHEGNYAMNGILGGARLAEREKAQVASR